MKQSGARRASKRAVPERFVRAWRQGLGHSQLHWRMFPTSRETVSTGRYCPAEGRTRFSTEISDMAIEVRRLRKGGRGSNPCHDWEMEYRVDSVQEKGMRRLDKRQRVQDRYGLQRESTTPRQTSRNGIIRVHKAFDLQELGRTSVPDSAAVSVSAGRRSTRK